MRIVSIQFYPRDECIASKMEIRSAGDSNVYGVRGDDKAAKAVDRVLRENRATNKDAAFLKKLVTNAVRVGIGASGTHPW